ncbi:hypothetical protein [Streptomyces sp. NPDC059743]|uniref:hypothetical protein n=1 Tax=Streptomyces sp. NPDC059743 TaxID=3346928 RepID=UPI00364F5B69
MAVHIEGQTVRGAKVIGSDRRYEGVRLVKCTLSACSLAQFDDPEFSLVVRDSSMQGCRVDRCSVQGVFFDGVTIDGLAAKQLHRLYGCVFRRVVLRGKIGPIMAMGPHTGLAGREHYIAGMIEKYRDIEWALDISEAVFSDADFYYVPGHLIRRDPETQVLLSREKVKNVPREDFPLYAGIWASRFDETPFDTLVGVAPKASSNFSNYMSDIEWLRSRNLVE